MSKESGERLAFYMRVSSEEQAERMTIGTQEEFLEQYRGLYGHEVTGIYKDEAISGTVPLRERPGGRRLLEDATEGAFNVVLVYKLDRIGRTLLSVVDAHDRLDVCRVALRSATEPIDTSSPSGRLIFHMLASFAEFERGTIRERTQHGLHRAFRKGKQTGRIPYGYDIAEDGGFVLVDEEAAVVREVFSNIAGGSTL
jgi:site-specific DNA recombinase